MYLTQCDINTVGTTYRVILSTDCETVEILNITHSFVRSWHSTDCLLVLLSTHPREFSHPATNHFNVFDPDLDPNTHFFHGNKNTDIQGGAKRGPQTHDHNAV